MPKSWWLATLVLAAVTAGAVRVPLAGAARMASAYGRPVEVPVVVRPVVAGGVVPPDGVALVRRPSSTLPDGDVVPAGSAAGRTAVVDLVPGEVLLASKLAPRGLRGAAALLPAGLRAVAVPAPPLPIKARVDVLATGPTGATEIVAHRALVIAVDRPAATVTLAVSPEEAPALASALATATITLALTSP